MKGVEKLIVSIHMGGQELGVGEMVVSEGKI